MLLGGAGSGLMETIVEIEDLSVHFPIKNKGLFASVRGYVRAVNGVSFAIRRGETLGLIGESGSGKTTLGRALLRGVEPTAGRVTMRLDGDAAIDITALGSRELRTARRFMQMIFQDPYASLNPRMTVRDIIAEPLVALGLAGTSKETDAKVVEIATLCGLAREQLGRYPHAFSGGQRQRIAIARALVLKPPFVVCDEPISALDVSIQAQILELLRDLQQQLGLTYLLVAHDLAAVAYACDRVAVMYLGRIVELGPTSEIYGAPKHPYTEALMSAVPEPDPDRPMRPLLLTGERPDPASPPQGCAFHTRCRYATGLCSEEVPELVSGAKGRWTACHHAEELTLQGAQAQAEPQEGIYAK
jgi:peptide/nickel transport system ATP-binding protein